MKSFAINNINWILMGVIVLALGGLIALGVLYMSEESDQDKLADTKVEKNEELTNLNSGVVDEEAILVKALADLEELRSGIPTEMDDVNVMEFLITLADETNVDIIIKAGEAVEQDLAGESYMAVEITATINGTFDNILNFIDSIESGEIKTFDIGNCSIQGSGADWDVAMSMSLVSQASSS